MSSGLPTISEEARRAFQRDGAVQLKRVLAPDWVELARAGLEQAIAEPDALSGIVGRELRVDQFPAARVPALRRLIDESPIASWVGRMLDSPVRFYMDQLFYKPPGRIEATPWHQDTSYYNLEGHDLVRVWVSPDVVPRNASLEVVRGSHLWNVTYSPLAGRDPERDEKAKERLGRAVAGEPMIGPEAYEQSSQGSPWSQWSYWTAVKDRSLPEVPDIEAHRDSYEILGWHSEPGDVILFHGNILHAARGDVELANPRRAHASLWAGRDVHYLHRPGQVLPDPVALYDKKPASGQPLSDFPDVFPVSWDPARESTQKIE